MDINALRDELYTVNAERFGLQTRVAELEAENARLTTELFAARLAAEVFAAKPATTSFVDDLVAFPKFAAGYAATTLSDLWAQVPSIRFEWITDEARRRTSRLGPSAS